MEQLRLEALYLGLRTKKGVNLEDFNNRYQYNLFTEKKKMLDKLREEGFIPHPGRPSLPFPPASQSPTAFR